MSDIVKSFKPEELSKIGIEPSLRNYYLMKGLSCDSCKFHPQCVAYILSQNIPDSIEGFDIFTLRCPIILIERREHKEND